MMDAVNHPWGEPARDARIGAPMVMVCWEMPGSVSVSTSYLLVMVAGRWRCRRYPLADVCGPMVLLNFPRSRALKTKRRGMSAA
jgi:hypothetical protein